MTAPPDGTGSPLLLRNARIGSRGTVGSVQLAAGRIVRMGPRDWSCDGVQAVDVEGRTVLPGLWDAHVHMVQWASARRRVDLTSARSATAAADAVGLHVSRLRAHPELVVGYGFRDGLWPDRPHKRLLERLAPDASVMLVSNDLHTVWLSPAALASIGRAEHPTGVFREQDCLEVTAAVPQASVDELDRWVAEATRAAAARGVVGVIDFEYADNVRDWVRRFAAHDVAVRVSASVYPAYVEDVAGRMCTGDRVPGTLGLLEVGPAKLFVDGSLNTRTAYCHTPYPDSAASADPRGLLTTPPDELVDAMRHAAGHGIVPAVHAIGDRANAIALDAFERVPCRGRVEHAQLLDPADVPRFAALDLVVGVQPAHVAADRDVAERYWPGRTAHAFAFADLAATGARLEFGSDAPVAPLDPWLGVAAAVSRTGDDGRPPWHPEQELPLDVALAATARGRSRIRVGDPADLVVVDDDPAELTPKELASASVFGTLVAGRWTHRPPGLPA